MVNTYGIKMVGLKAASSSTKGLQGYYDGFYEELFYDRRSGQVWTVSQYCIGYNTWTEYHDRQIIKICNLVYHKTMQEIADLIKQCLDEIFCEV